MLHQRRRRDQRDDLALALRQRVPPRHVQNRYGPITIW